MRPDERRSLTPHTSAIDYTADGHGLDATHAHTEGDG